MRGKTDVCKQPSYIQLDGRRWELDLLQKALRQIRATEHTLLMTTATGRVTSFVRGPRRVDIVMTVSSGGVLI